MSGTDESMRRRNSDQERAQSTQLQQQQHRSAADQSNLLFSPPSQQAAPPAPEYNNRSSELSQPVHGKGQMDSYFLASPRSESNAPVPELVHHHHAPRGSPLERVKDTFLNFFDSYGESLGGDPRMKRKTMCGAISSILFKIAFIGLVIFAIVRFATTDLSTSTGDMVTFNLHPDADDSVVDYPAMYLEQQNRILFYEKDDTSLQRIDVVDRNGVTPAPRWSSVAENTVNPTTKAIYGKTSVQFNSYITSVSKVPPPQPETAFSLDDLIKLDATHEYLSQSIRSLYEQNQHVDQTTELYNHTMVTFVRFTPGQLESLKKCQFQVSLVNSKEYTEILGKQPEKLLNSSVDDEHTFPSLNSDTFTWGKKLFDKDTGKWKLDTGAINLLRLSRDYSIEDAKKFIENNKLDDSALSVPASFLDWKLLMAYTNNFYTLTEDFVCSTDSHFSQVRASASVLIDATTTTIPGNKISTLKNEQPNWMTSTISTPFNIMIWGSVGYEIAQVTNIASDNTITLKRGSNAVDFSVAPSATTPQVSKRVPSGWTCEPERYGDGVCDCECGVLDNPDCFSTAFESPTCSETERCSLHAVCVPARAQKNSDKILLSDACSSDILEKGGVYQTGYIGSQSSLDTADCSVCPGDSLYNYQAQYDPDRRQYYCNYVANGYIDANEVESFDISTTGTPARSYVKLPITLHKKPAFPLLSTSGSAEDEYTVTFYPDNDDDTTSLTVAEALNKVNGSQIVGFFQSSSMDDVTDIYDLLTTGELVALSSESTSAVFIPREVTSPGRPPITMDSPTGVEYPLTLSKGKTVFVSTATKSKYMAKLGKSFQLLSLAKYPSDDIGVVGLTVNAESIARDTLELTFDISSTTTFEDHKEFFTAGPTSGFSLFIYDTANPEASEYIAIKQVEKLFAWTGEPSRYNAKDKYCDCGFNQYDPDCGRPNAYDYIGNEDAIKAAQFIRGCNATHPFCALNGECSSTRVPIAQRNTPIPENRLQVNITLNSATSAPHQTATSQFYISSAETVNARRNTPVRLSRESGTQEYNPSQRYQSQYYENFQSPSQIDVEVAMFLVPTLKSIKETNYCPNIQVTNNLASSTDFSDWKIDDDFVMKASCGSLKDLTFTTCDSIANHSDLSDTNLISTSLCLKEMPPKRTYEYNVTYPVNFKFSESSEGTRSSAGEPEYIFDFENIYQFSYDQTVEGVEKKFAENTEVGGDTFLKGANTFQTREYYGAPLYRGVGDGTGVSLDLPASVPYLSPNFTLRVNASRTVEEIMDKGADFWPGNADSIRSMLDTGFEDLQIAWDLRQVDGSINYDSSGAAFIPMEPGYTYTLLATVQITPLYTENRPWSIMGSFFWWIDTNKLSSWRLRVVTTQVQRQNSANVYPNDFRMRFIISFDSKNTQILEVRSYTVQSFLSDIGAYMAILGVGISLVSLWQTFLSFFGRDVHVVDFREQQVVKIQKKKIKKEIKKSGPGTPREDREMVPLQEIPSARTEDTKQQSVHQDRKSDSDSDSD